MGFNPPPPSHLYCCTERLIGFFILCMGAMKKWNVWSCIHIFFFFHLDRYGTKFPTFPLGIRREGLPSDSCLRVSVVRGECLILALDFVGFFLARLSRPLRRDQTKEGARRQLPLGSCSYGGMFDPGSSFCWIFFFLACLLYWYRLVFIFLLNYFFPFPFFFFRLDRYGTKFPTFNLGIRREGLPSDSCPRVSVVSGECLILDLDFVGFFSG